MPRHDFSPSRPRRDLGGRSFTRVLASLAWAQRRQSRKRKPGKDKDEGGVPVVPNRPLGLSGGAAAELEPDD